MLAYIEFSRGERRYRARVLPFPVDAATPSFWCVSVSAGPPRQLFEARPDDVDDETFEAKLIEAIERLPT